MTSAPTIQPRFLPSRHDLGIVAVGFSGGQPKAGVDAAPMALIENGLIKQLEEELDYNVTYDGQVHAYTELQPASDPDYRGMKRPKFASAVTKQVSDQVYTHARSGKLVLTLGGDHSIAIGTVSGTAKAIRERLGKEIAVIWVDAHADINTPETSDSGNIHGMPVSFLTGLATEEREDVFGWIKEEHRLSTKKLVYIGLRDIDKERRRFCASMVSRRFPCMILIDMVSAKSWIWRWVGSAAIPRFISRLTSTLSTPCGRLVPARLFVVV
ncbi:A-agglutinin attachment subunit precursor [Pyrenophora teres f. teres]|nr:A-agglutinin attachment subunit precursor [Pyrenophora teres f. teres]